MIAALLRAPENYHLVILVLLFLLDLSFRHKVAAGSERVVTMLPNNAIVETVYKVARFLLQLFFRDNSNLFQEVLDNAISGSLLIDCSTVSNRVLLQKVFETSA